MKYHRAGLQDGCSAVADQRLLGERWTGEWEGEVDQTGGRQSDWGQVEVNCLAEAGQAEERQSGGGRVEEWQAENGLAEDRQSGGGQVEVNRLAEVGQAEGRQSGGGQVGEGQAQSGLAEGRAEERQSEQGQVEEWRRCLVRKILASRSQPWKPSVVLNEAAG